MPPKRKYPPWKFNSSPLKSYHPNRKVVFQPSFFRGYVKLREGICVKFCPKVSKLKVPPTGLNPKNHGHHQGNVPTNFPYCHVISQRSYLGRTFSIALPQKTSFCWGGRAPKFPILNQRNLALNLQFRATLS